MIPILYPSTETAFENNGLGGLPDAISCVVTEQRNTQGGYYLEMEYPIDGLHYDLLAPERVIYAAPSMGNTPQPFRISRITRPINGIVHIEAPHLCAELQKLTSWGIDTGTNVQGMIYNQFYRARQLGQTVPFWCNTDITVESNVTFSHPEPTSLADILLGSEGSVLDVVGGEYEWDGYHIILHRQRGVDSGLEIRYGVNMSDLEAETDATELVTACVPFWKGTVNEQDVVVMGDMCKADNADAYAYVRCVPLDVSQQFELEQDTQPSVIDVTAKGTAFINSTSRKLLQTSIRVSYEPTTSGIGERRINLCDTVRVVYPDLNVSSISKVVETKFNVLVERYDELTIGTIRNNIVDTIAGLISGGSSYSGGGSGGGGGGSSAVTSVNGMTGDVVLNAASVGALPNTYTAPVTSVNGMTGDVVVPSGGGGAVDSVNGQTGVVVLDAEDVGAVAAESGAVLKNYLASDVKSSLGKADNAVLFTENQGLNTSQQGHARANIGAGISTVTYQNNQLIIQNPGEAYKVIDLSSADVFSVVIQKTSSANTASKTFSQIATAVGNGKIIEFDFEDSTTGESYYSFDFCVKNGSNNLLELEVKFCRQVSSSLAKYFVATFYSNDTFALSEVTLTGGGSGSGNFIKITYNSNTADVTHNGTAITGSQIKTLLDQNDSGAIMVDTNGSPNAVYGLKNIYSDGKVEFEGEIGDNIINVIVPANGSTGNATVSRKPQVYYYLDGTTVKSAQTNFAVTGQQIQTATINNGLAPIIYKYESSDYITYEYHFFSFHSGGLNFRTLDGKKLIFVPWNSSTATITQSAGYSANIVFYLDGTTVKYTGTNTAVTGSDIQAITLAVGIMPVVRQTINGVDYYYYLQVAHSAGVEFRLLDGTKDLSLSYNSSTATITTNYYAVTLNADGTVNTFDSALTYSVASASVLNGTSKKLIITWGNTIFTADANEKLSGANGDVKFIGDCEHDGIQRHIIFTLTSANALQTTLIETYARVPITVWEVADVTQGLIALNANISSSLAWQLTGLNLSPFKRIKVYAKAGRKTGAMAADSSIVPAAIIEMLLDDRAKETVSQNVFLGSAVVQNPNDANRLGMLTCAVSGDKTKFAVLRATSLYGTAATSNTDCYQYVFKIEGYYD